MKAWVRYDGSNQLVPGGPLLSKNKPKVGNWQEIPAYLCCNPPADTCISYTATCIATGVLSYTDCYGEVISPVNLSEGQEIVFCAVPGSVQVLSGGIYVEAGRACTVTTTTTTPT